VKEMYQLATTLAETKLKELFATTNIDLNRSKPSEIWKVIKEFVKIKVKPKNNEICASDSYIFECSLSREENCYQLILTRLFKISWSDIPGFMESITEYFHFIFSYQPAEEYKDFKGQLYSDDFGSTIMFFETMEQKDIFKTHMNIYKPINIKYSIGSKHITNFC
jgi:hypothetical protein